MERCSLLRTESLLVVVLTATVLSGCLSAPEPADAGTIEGAARVDPLQWIPSGPLRTALEPEPRTFLDAPTDAASAMRMWTDFTPVPLPTPTPVRPLDDALARFATAHHTAVPEHHLDDAGLTAAQETALARVVLTFLEAEVLQSQAVAELDDEELAFLFGEPYAVDAWSARTGQTTPDEYEREARRIVDGIDVAKNLQAADLLVRAVDELRAAFDGVDPVSVPASNHLPSQVPDEDDDDTPDPVETAIGSEPDDGDDHGGSLLRGEADPNGVLLRIPSPGGAAPGLVITGAGVSVVTDDPLVHIDLGGDDEYRAQGFGGVTFPSFAGGMAIPPLSANDRDQLVRRSPLVKLAVDLGGNDDYFPEPFEHVRNIGFNDPVSGPLTQRASALGGALAGVSVLLDAGGDDEYVSSGSVNVFAEQDGSRDNQATGALYGTMQGGGTFGGVGVLLDLGGDDRYDASVEAKASENTDGTHNTPIAVAVGIAQGGGWIGGLGVLLDLHDGLGTNDDTFTINAYADTITHEFSTTAGATTAASGQGASFSGAGILVDLVGTATMTADAPIAQGAAFTAYDNRLPTHAIGNPAGGSFPYVSTLPSLGLLFGSDGDGTYDAATSSQGAARGAHGKGGVPGDPWILHYQDATRSAVMTRDQTETFYAPAVGVLIDTGGDDRYTVRPDPISVARDLQVEVVQGSALLGAAALLLDAAGDDRYDAAGALFAQGAGWLAQGLLVDQFGHDHYTASGKSQGYATDDPRILLDARMCAGNPTHKNNFIVGYFALNQVPCPEEDVQPGVLDHGDGQAYEDGTYEAVAKLRAQLPTLGVLVDRHGIDRYEADSESQGVAVGHLQHTAEAGACHSGKAYVGPLTSLSAATKVREELPPYLEVCDPQYPNRRSDVERGREVGEWTEPDTSAPPVHTFVLGLLLDAANHDTYVYGPNGDPYGGDPPSKEPADPEAPDDVDGNRWEWKQETVPVRGVEHTRLPQDLDGESDDIESQPVVGPTLNNPDLGIQQSFPRQAHAVYGRGIDDDTIAGTVDTLLGGVFASEVVQITLSLHDEEDADEEATIDEASGVAWARLEVTLRDSLDLQRIDLLASGIHIDRLDGVTGSGVYWLPWDTRELVGIDVRFPDGDYSLQASAVVDAPAYGPVSFESNRLDGIVVNNPPIIHVDVDKDAISPPQGHEAVLSMTIFADGRFPTPDEATNGLTEEERDDLQATGRKPGASVTVLYDGAAGQFVTSPVDYYWADQHQVVLDESCVPDVLDCPASGVVPDGRYTIVVRAMDSDLNVVEDTEYGLLIDGTFPRSRVDLDSYSNKEDSPSAGALRVPYSLHNVLPTTLADPSVETDPAEVADVAAVLVYRSGDGGATWKRVAQPGTSGFVQSSEPNVADGTPTFLSVAVDALGNSESPCTAAELAADPAAPVCVSRKLERLASDPTLPDGEPNLEHVAAEFGPVQTTVDFLPPLVESLELLPEHGFIAPGEEVGEPGRTEAVFRATVSDEGTGIPPEQVFIQIGDLRTEMRLDQATEKGGIYVYDEWHLVNGGLSAEEEPFVYTVEVSDRAGNRDDNAGVGTLDLVEPQVTIDTVRYRDAEGERRGAGGPGSMVEVLLDVVDARVDPDGVEADFSEVHDSLGVRRCSADRDSPRLTAMICRAILPAGEDGVQDGVYDVTVTARDLAGNVGTDATQVVLNNDEVLISDLRVTRTGPDSLDVAWTTDVPATSRVYYGRTSSLGFASDRDPGPTTNHEVTLSGLSPSTTYFLVAASENLAGTESLSEELTHTTSGAIGVQFVDVREGAVMSGTATVEATLAVATPGEELSVRLFSTRPDGGGRQRLAEATSPGGIVTFELDTATLGDGPARLLLQASRGRDTAEALSATFVVDNTEPTLVPVRPLPTMGLLATAPVVDLLVFDAGSGADLDLSTLQVRLDDAPVTPVDVALSGSGMSRGLRITLPPMVEGEHELEVLLVDGAGNEGSLLLPFTAGDDAGQDAGRVDYRGTEAASPGRTVTFLFDSFTPLDGVAVDPSPVGLGLVDLQGGAFWSGDWTLPASAPDGTYLLDVVVTDLQGQTERIPNAMELVVDATPPTARVSTAATGPTALDLGVEASEPVTVRVLLGQRLLAEETEAAEEHVFSLKGLQSGSELFLDIVVTDKGGQSSSVQRPVLTPADVTPPTAVPDVTATVHGSDVFLTWSPAQDDGAVSAYRVQRDGWDRSIPSTSTVDRGAPGGANLTYHVAAVDDAGNVGPARSVTVHVESSIEFLETHVLPEAGDTRTPFDVRVLLRHNLPENPDVTLDLTDRTVTLTPENETADCRDACWYTAVTRLPATLIGAEDLPLRASGGTVTEEASIPSSAVTVLRGAPEEAESPGPLPVLALLGALLLARRWRK